MPIPLRYISVRGQRSRASMTSPLLCGSSVIFHVLLCEMSTLLSYLFWTLPPNFLLLTCVDPSFSQSSVDVNKHDDEEVQEGANDPQQGQDRLLAPLYPLVPEPPLYWRWSSPFCPPHLCLHGCLSVEKQESSMRQTIDKSGSLLAATRSVHPEARQSALCSGTEGEISLSADCPAASLA